MWWDAHVTTVYASGGRRAVRASQGYSEPAVECACCACMIEISATFKLASTVCDSDPEARKKLTDAAPVAPIPFLGFTSFH